jgi:ornithine cyclodeaminase/alanine dehydrogenase-like protein (mu-crystallin family)
MTLVLSNEEINRILTMADLIPAFEDAYVELAEERGANGPRSDIVTPTAYGANGFYSLKSMDGVIPKFKKGAIRLNSDILGFPKTGGAARRVKIGAAPGGRYVGLVLLFNTDDGAPLMICPDGVMQRMRVGATSAIAAKHMARRDSKSVAILGSSGQAMAQLQGLDAVFAITDVRVYSPDAAHRERFAREMGTLLGKQVRTFDSPADACKGADIVACATNSLDPVFFKEWVERGMYAMSIRAGATEIDRAAWPEFDRIAMFNDTDMAFSLRTHGLKLSVDKTPPLPADMPTLLDILTGKVPGRAREDEATCFLNNNGMGYQFAVAGHVVYEKARALGIGRELPTDWFTETEPS